MNFELCEYCKKNQCDSCREEWESSGEDFFCSCSCRDFDSIYEEDDEYFYDKGEAWDKWGYEDEESAWN